jgi:TatD DNase family protein
MLHQDSPERQWQWTCPFIILSLTRALAYTDKYLNSHDEITSASDSMMYVDVHTHLTHDKFLDDWRDVTARALAANLGAIVVNGLEPQSNRRILDMAKEFPQIKPALGIYPIDAVNHLLPETFSLPIVRFAVDDEIAFIREQALAGKLHAIGECGLDAYWLTEETFSEQERVFRALINIALDADLPIIIHTRKLEERSGDILSEMNVKRVNFHCFGGKVKLAQKYAELHGWYFSIPANAGVNESFQKMLKLLPLEQILTETDAPFLAPVRGERNEPKHVQGTVKLLAEFRDMSVEEARDQVWANYLRLFRPS